MTRNAPSNVSRRESSGFTLLEVMIAVAIMTVGAVGLIGMQTTATKANREARELAVAQTIARTWMERLRREALRWNVGSATAAAALPTLPPMLTVVQPENGVAAWQATGPTSVASDSPNFSFTGAELAVGDAAVFFCADYRLQWVNPGQTMRADVLIFWPRNAGLMPADCTPPGGIDADPTYKKFYLSTLLRWTPRQ